MQLSISDIFGDSDKCNSGSNNYNHKKSKLQDRITDEFAVNLANENDT
jgi:hypothetical protein